MSERTVYYKEVKPLDLGGGVTRRVLARQEQLMIVEVSFEKDSVGAAHRHIHAQNTYVLSGRFRFTVEGEEIEVAAGDSLAIPSNAIHGLLCLEKGAVLDVFTPQREDFL